MTFEPVLPLWLLLLLLSVLLTIAVVMEWRRPLRFRALRLSCCFLMAAALFGILSRPARLQTAGNRTVLLTGEYSRTVADSLRRSWPEATFYSLGTKKYRGSTELSSYRELLHGFRDGKDQSKPNLSAIVGIGLPPYALDSLQSGFRYFRSPVPDGITSISCSSDLQRNKEATLQGTYKASHLPAKLYFSSPAGKLDSVEIRSIAGSFRFQFTPRTTGNITYALTLADSIGRQTEERVPLTVRSFTPLNILMLQGYPTFEMLHLKNFLSDRGHRLAVRAQVSRNVYRTEFANRAGTPLTKLTPSLLGEFDLVLVDVASALNASASERAVLESSMRDGLGIVTVFDGAPPKMPGKELLPFNFTQTLADTVSIGINNKRYTLRAVKLVAGEFNGTALSRVRSGILSGYTPVRKGASGFQLLQETYSLLLAGDSLAYGTLWSPLIEGTARARRTDSSIGIVSAFPYVIDEPVEVRVISGTTPGLFADNTPTPVREDPVIDGIWYATIWPRSSGWHTMRTEADTLSFYAFDQNDWRALRIAERQEQNALAAQKIPAGEGPLTRLPMSPVIFFLAFILSTGFLWLAPRL